MPRLDLTLGVDVVRTPRVQQLEGIFDVPEQKRITLDLHMDVPLEDRDWQIGLIVGPSGAGKSSAAKQLFGDAIIDGYDWPRNKSLLDGFGDTPIKDITAALSSVGFSSPPSWAKPFAVLSTGEKFRANMARTILDPRDLVVVDEFTSVVDRTVGRIGSHAIAKSIRRIPGKKFVAVTCHDDVTEWLQPDWVLEPHLSRFDWRLLRRRPGIQLEIVRVDHSAWQWFARHHYLSGDLAHPARCFAALIDGVPVALSAVMHWAHPTVKNYVRGHRMVVLPDYQGVGIESALTDFVASVAARMGYVMLITTSHPGLSGRLARSPNWHLTRMGAIKKAMYQRSKRDWQGKRNGEHCATANFRRTANFRYCGQVFSDAAMAAQMWAK